MLREALPCPERRLRALGTEVRVVACGPDATVALSHALAVIRRGERLLSRFDARSDLSRLNADPHPEVHVSQLLCRALRAALDAAHASDGLVVPTLLQALERAGYDRSLAGTPRPGFTLGAWRQPLRAAADPAARWREIEIDDQAGTVRRPPGLRLDLGGTAKGFLADLAARELTGCERWLVDCGGDLRVGGTAQERQDVQVELPPDCAPVVLRLADGAAATSAVHARCWAAPDGSTAHHLLDPATGTPVWTGLLQVTALAPTVLEAETRAKTALLGGPTAAGEVLARFGGVLVRDTGEVDLVGLTAEEVAT